MVKVAVREVLDIIKSHPQNWIPVKGMFQWDGIELGDVKITGYGNPKVISVIDLLVCDKRVQLSWIDMYYLEKAVQKWYKTVPLEQF